MQLSTRTKIKTRRAGAEATDREQVAVIAAKIPATGRVIVGKVLAPIIGSRFVKMGAKCTANYSRVAYVLKRIAVDRTPFSLCLNGEEITRPIKPRAKTSP